MTRRRALIIAAVVVLAVTGYLVRPMGGDRGGPAGGGPLTVATGGTKGVYYQYGRAFAEAASGRLGQIQLLPTTGSLENLSLLADGKATFAFTAADAALDAYSAGVGLRAVARLYDDYIHLVTPADSAVRGVTDLRGLRVSVGPPGSGTALIADRILTATGLDPQRDIVRSGLSINDSVTALRDHQIDAFFWSGGLPTSGVTELATGTALHLVDLAQAAAALRARYGSSYRTGTIPAGTYPGVDSPVTTVAVPNLLVTLAGTGTALVNQVAQALFASAGRIGESIPAAGQLDPRSSIFTGAIPLHDGARDYYRSVKL
jgi:TRAP transporter TAXI family solute receptor